MSASEVETIELNLDGNFAPAAEKSAGAADHLSSSLTKLGSAAPKASSGTAKLGDDAARTGQAVQKMGGASQSAGGQVEGLGASLGKAGPAAAALAAELIALAAVAKTIEIGTKFAVDKSSEKEIQKAVFGKLGNAGGFELALDVAAKFNLDEGKALEQVKTLLDAKIGGKELIDWEKIIAGVSLVRGEGKAQALLEKLATQTKKGGKANEEAIKGFAEAGVDVDKVWAKLATKLGVSVDQAKAKVKSGAVDMKTALDAVRAAASEDFGALAEKVGGTVPGLLNSLKIQFGKLFADVNLQPLKDALQAVIDILKGDVGTKLGGAIKELFGAGFELIFGTIAAHKGDLSAAFSTAADVIKKVAGFIKDITPGVRKFIDGFKEGFKEVSPVLGKLSGVFLDLVGKMGGSSGIIETIGKGFGFLVGVVGLAVEVVATMAGAIGVVIGAFFALGGAVWGVIADVVAAIDDGITWITNALGLGDAQSQAQAGGQAVGTSLIDGITNALFGGADGPIGAITGVIDRVIAAAHSAADAHSPSRKMAKLGGWMTEGLAVGQAQNDNASKAAESTVNDAMGAAAGAAGVGAGAAAGGPAGPSQINVTVIVQGGGSLSADQLEAVRKAASDGAYEGYLRATRRAGREAQEGSKAA